MTRTSFVSLSGLALALAFALPAPLAAQVTPGQAGMIFVNGDATVGDPCGFAFTCTPAAGSASPGDRVSLVVQGAHEAPYALFVAATATGCQTFPGVANALALDPPLLLVALGSLDEISPILACPEGWDTLTFSFPGLPPGTSFVLQAYTFGSGSVPSLTRPIRIDVT